MASSKTNPRHSKKPIVSGREAATPSTRRSSRDKRKAGRSTTPKASTTGEGMRPSTDGPYFLWHPSRKGKALFGPSIWTCTKHPKWNAQNAAERGLDPRDLKCPECRKALVLQNIECLREQMKDLPLTRFDAAYRQIPPLKDEESPPTTGGRTAGRKAGKRPPPLRRRRVPTERCPSGACSPA